jgi:PAS domain S-box-containing protein
MDELRILLLEDDSSDAELIQRELAGGGLAFAMERVEDEPSFRRALELEPTLILADYHLPTFSGMEALEIVKGLGSRVPLILVSGTLGEEAAVECVKQGATDYVSKDRLARLVPAVTRALRDVESDRERRRLEEEVERAERQVAHILDHMPAGFFTLDPELRFTYVNRAVEKVWRRSAVTLLGSSIVEAFPEIQGTELGSLAAHPPIDEPKFFEAYYPARDAWIEVHAYPTEDGFSVYFRDVTEEHRVEEALFQAQEEFRTIVEQLPAITYVDDYLAGKGGDIYVSPQLESILGYGTHEWLEDRNFWWDHTHPDDRDRVDELDRRARELGTPFEAEYRMIAKDGRTVWFHDRATVLPRGDGTPLVHGVMLDVTQQKEAEETLRRREAILEAVAFAADHLLRAADWHEGIDEVLEHVGAAAGADRAAIVEVVGEVGSRRGRIASEWCAAGLTPVIDDFQDVSLEGPGFEFLDRLAAGHPVWIPNAPPPPGIGSAAGRLGIRSVAMIPLFGGGRWLGYAAFADPNEARKWALSEIDALTAAADAIGAAIARAELLEALEASEREFRSLAENSLDLVGRYNREPRVLYANPAIQALGGPLARVLGTLSGELGPPVAPTADYDWEDTLGRWHEVMDDALAGRTSGGEFAYPTGRGLKTFEIRMIPEFDGGGEVETILVLGHDITHRRRVEHNLSERMKELACMLAVSSDVREGLDPQQLSERAALHLARAMQYPESAQATVDLDGASGASGDGGASASGPEGDTERLEAPIRAGGQERGRVLVWYQEAQQFIPEEHILVESVADTLSAWLEHREAEERLLVSHDALRRSNERRLDLLARLVRAQEEERHQIANDLHDDSIQVMTAAGLRLSLLHRWLDEQQAHEDLEQTEEIVRLAIVRLRHLLFELYPVGLEREGLAATLRDNERLLGEEGAGLEVKVEDRMTSEPQPGTRVILYRLCQEALANVRQHAQARTVHILLEAERQGIHVSIRDDGIGFDPDSISPFEPGHLGLSSMRERAQLAGGWFRVESAPGAGTTVEFWVPTIMTPSANAA